MNKNSQFEWDELSDQPHVIRDKIFRKSLRASVKFHFIKNIFIFFLFFPFVFMLSLFKTRVKQKIRGEDFFGLCVNLDRLPEVTPEWVKDLEIKKISIRIPIGDVKNISQYVAFCESMPGSCFYFVVLQDREHIIDADLSKKSLTAIFSALSPFSDLFQISNAVNRVKWAFASVEQSLQFFLIAQAVRDAHFPNIKLVGSSVIDFEPVDFLRSVFHLYPIYFDRVASLLYVDRRGAPENKQMNFFNLRRKIAFHYAALCLSPKTSKRTIINETNWPLIDRDGYAPAKGDCCVSEQAAAEFLVRYYIEAWQTGMVDTVYWHQLVAPGYGLIDHCVDVEKDKKGNAIARKMPAYYALKTLVGFLQHAELTDVHIHGDIYCAYFILSDDSSVHVYWALDEQPCDALKNYSRVYSISGERLFEKNQSEPLTSCGPSVLYCFT